MLKIVPDPPLPPTDSPYALEDTLVHACDHLTCALVVAQQAALIHPEPQGQVLVRAAVHEMEMARRRVELALTSIQLRS